MHDLGRRTLSTELFWTGLAVLSMFGAGGVIALALLKISPILVVAGILAVLGCSVVLFRPFLGILLFLTLMYWRPELYAPGVAEMRLPLLLSFLTLFAWLIQVVMKRETCIWRPELAWVGAFGVTMLLSAAQVPGGKTLVLCLLDASRLWLLVLILQQLLNSTQRASVALQLFLALTVIVSLYAIYGWVTETTVLNEHGVKRAIVAVGDFDDPNDLSAALVIPVPIALLLVMRARSIWGKLWGLTALGILVTAIYLCDSRGGMLALCVALGVFLVHQLGVKRGIMLGAVALVVLLAFGPQRFKTDSVQGDDSTLGRIQAWNAGLGMFRKSPLIGVGYDQFEKRHPIPAHNSLVHSLAECGLLNALCWVGMNYWALLTLWRLRKAEWVGKVSGVWLGYPAALQAGLLASLTAGMFLSHSYRPIPLIPVAFAAALAGIAQLRGTKHDWVHVLGVGLLTLTLVGMIYVAVAVAL